jgi:predicted DNA-binding transcriptional regulator AlpA
MEAASVSKHAATFDRACSQYGFPKPISLASSNVLSTQTIGYRWSEAAVNRWLADARVRLYELRELVDGER